MEAQSHQPLGNAEALSLDSASRVTKVACSLVIYNRNKKTGSEKCLRDYHFMRQGHCCCQMIYGFKFFVSLSAADDF